MSIKNISKTSEYLTINRIRDIRQLIKPIAANSSIQPKRVPSTNGDNRIVFCVTDSARIIETSQFGKSSEINERFKTKNSSFTASFYELWDKDPGTKNLYLLNRIYFHLYLTGEEECEYILLHTDPSDNDKTHGDYKRSPHLHIKRSDDDTIRHAHLALNINDYDVVMSSLEEMQKCFKNHITMLAKQILKITS
jgi:hypothetical protein